MNPDIPSLRDAILLIEDVDEPPYKVDRMLTQLRRSGALDGIVGVAVGQFTWCGDGWPTTVVDVLHDRLGDLGVPVLGGSSGARASPCATPTGTDVVEHAQVPRWGWGVAPAYRP